MDVTEPNWNGLPVDHPQMEFGFPFSRILLGQADLS